MNKHFRDARYYQRRAAEHFVRGVREELEPVEMRLRELTGREFEPKPTRVEVVRKELTDTERRAADRARRTVDRVRSRT